MAESITDLVRALETERDALRARVANLTARSEAQDLTRELDAYAGQVAAIEHSPSEQVQSTPRSARRRSDGTPLKCARRYSDEDVRRWRDALRADTPIGDVAQRENVRPETILRRVRKLGPDPRPVSPPEEEEAAGPEPPFPPLGSTNGPDVAAATSS